MNKFFVIGCTILVGSSLTYTELTRWPTPTIDYDAMLKQATEDPRSLWAAEVPTARGHDQQKAPYHGGFGSLWQPAQNEVIRCRTQTDTTCRAIQVLDHGFPERPRLPETLPPRHDAIVKPVPPPTYPQDCHHETIVLPGYSTEEVCHTGYLTNPAIISPYEKVGVAETSLWRCQNRLGQESIFTCRIPQDFVTKPSYRSRCYFGDQACETTQRITQPVTPTVTATWDATCKAPQARFFQEVCSQSLEIKTGPSCQLGSKTHVRNTIVPLSSACGKASTLKLAKRCSATQPTRLIRAQVPFYPAATLFLGPTEVTSTQDSSCRCRYRILEHSCNDGHCQTKVLARTYLLQNQSRFLLNEITATLYFEAYRRDALEEIWTDTCQ